MEKCSVKLQLLQIVPTSLLGADVRFVTHNKGAREVNNCYDIYY